MEKKIKIVTLPTKDIKSKVWKNNSTGKLFYFEKTPNTIIRNTYTPQYLYFLSDEEIQEGDWFSYNEDVDMIDQYFKNNTVISEHCKKIITTTDESLNLPRPTNEFLKKYCELGGIDECLVEYELSTYDDWIKTGEAQSKYKLKIAPDNTTNVSFIEEKMYSREEVVDLFNKWFEDYHNSNETFVWRSTLNDWIKENL